jgi:hypothetical protein
VATVESEIPVTSSLQVVAREFLSLIEKKEARLLSWGFFEVGLGPDDLEELLTELPGDGAAEKPRAAWQRLVSQGWEAEDLIDEMERSGLLFRVGLRADTYRSRFAEGIRLLVRLRQMFRAEDWAGGPRLVSDLKLHLTPRRYPRRDQPATDCWEDLIPLCWDLPLQRDAFLALTRRPDGKSMEFSGFQRRAFQRILGAYRAEGRSGSVVSAGTGSGKTKAFYIPAFLGLVTELGESRPSSPRIVATYPRNVLLADQLREALSEAAKLQPVLGRAGLRPIRFGALLGQTPQENWFQKGNEERARWSNWKRTDAGWVVPFLKSPLNPDHDLVWRDEDRRHGRTCLYRTGAPTATPDVPDGVLSLTREQLQQDPPDVLFVSLEMLNREMGSPDWARLFGIGPTGHPPRLLLLDEVHAYEGVGGAQIAWVLRRWQHWARAESLHVVGLSATLRDAAQHLSRISGVPAEAVVELRPHAAEFESEGMEYSVALKGDPASGTALLSTTIQAGMLLTRLLTPRSALRAEPADDRLDGSDFYARKVFGFTDNLDALNRWFSDLSDAERKRRLARLRLHPSHRTPPLSVPDSLLQAIDAEGQLWELPRRLGHQLDSPLHVTRCSSQDPGANAGSDMIVASASLEVGFDDPEVGAMLHHKRPASLASFVQRKGRAGRRRGTRPWTIVVLSDYGADRWAFQNAETLFQPELERIRLPLHNPHVLRIQATYFLIDWLGHRIGTGRPFGYLADPREAPAARRAAVEILREMLRLGLAWQEFRDAFAVVFSRPWGTDEPGLDEADLDAILWNVPRPLLRQVVPSLLRKLETAWGFAHPARQGEREDRRAYRPLPQFLPSATFAELNPSETRLQFADLADRQDEYLSVGRALFETCPGRVSKRYALKVGEAGYWLAFSDELATHSGLVTAPVRDLFADRVLLGQVGGVRIYEPLTAELCHRPREVSDQSTSAWEWESQFVPAGSGRRLPGFLNPPWTGYLELSAFLHRDYSGIEVARYARACRYEIRTGNTLFRGRVLLASGTDTEGIIPEAVGFRLRVDGLRLRIAPEHLRNLPDLDEAMMARFRSGYYRDRILQSEILSDRINNFQAEWLWQTSTAMLSATALANDCSLATAQERLSGHRVAAARKVLDRIFQVRDAGDGNGGESRRKTEILDLWADPVITDEIQCLEATLWTTPGPDFDEWVRRRYVATLAQALRAAAVHIVPEVGEDDLAVDVQWEVGGSAECYLTETTTGGLGQVERIMEQIRADPAIFQQAFMGVLEICPRERLANTLRQAARWAARPPATRKNPIQLAFQQVRSADTFDEQETAWRELRTALEIVGLVSARETVVALTLRLLRAGTSPDTDLWVRRLSRFQRFVDRRLGVSIDPRVFAYLCVQQPAIQVPIAALLRSVGETDLSDVQLYNALQHFLLPGCDDSCPECLNHPNRFSDFGTPSRDLALRWNALNVPHVRWNQAMGVDGLRAVVQRSGRFRLLVSKPDLPSATAAIQALLAEEIEVGYLLLPMSVTRVERHRLDWAITLETSRGGLDG